ncbi:MAG: hypothetical protein OXB94_11125 [Nitrospira sp.]|nr:hypothetical protein [Nitrospira sp.]
MSDSVIFDTHACVKRMTKAGVEPHVAEAWAAEQVNILEHNIATKTDIADVHHAIEILRKDTTAATEALRKDTTTLVLEAKNELTKAIADSQFKTILSLAGYATLLAVLAKFF